LDGEGKEKVDWRNKGAVSPVKNQLSCNAGWAFAATGAMETVFWNKSSSIVSFSE